MASAFKNTAFYAFGTIVKVLSSFVLLPVFANILGAEQYGIFNILQTFSTILSILMTFAVERSIYRLLYDYKTENEKNQYLSTVFWLINGISIFIILLTLLFSKFISSLVGDVDVFYVLLPVILYTFLSALINYTQILMQVEQNGGEFLKVSLLILILYNISSIIFLFFYKKTVESLVYGNLLANILILPYAFYRIKSKIHLFFSISIAIKVFRYSSPMLLMVVFAWILNMTDRLFIGNMIDYRETGIYSLASKMTQAVTLFIGAIFQAYGPLFYKTTSELSYEDAKKKLEPINSSISMIICLSIIVLCIVCRPILSVFFSEEYGKSFIYVHILSIACLFSQMTGTLNLMIYQNKKTFGLSVIVIISAIVNFLLNLFLIPIYGAIVASYANLISSITLFSLTYRLAKANYYIPINMKIIIISVIIAIVISLIDNSSTSLIIGFLSKIAIFITMIIVLFKFGIISNDIKEIYYLIALKIKNKS